MPREIKSVADATTVAAGPASQVSDFKDRLVKLIPSEIVTAYITLQGLISSQIKYQQIFILIAFISLLILTPFYLKLVSNVNKAGQIVFTTVAFVIWVSASGGFKLIFPTIELFNNNFLGSLILIIYTLIIPFVYKG